MEGFRFPEIFSSLLDKDGGGKGPQGTGGRGEALSVSRFCCRLVLQGWSGVDQESALRPYTDALCSLQDLGAQPGSSWEQFVAPHFSSSQQPLPQIPGTPNLLGEGQVFCIVTMELH